MLEKEVLEPARHRIHDIFLEHVMMHAPGYHTLISWAEGHVKPTPVAVGEALRFVADRTGGDILAVDVGGATTDVFSVIDSQFYRTVSANLGMSYSMGNVLSEATPEMVLRWLPFEADENTVRNWNFNKMIRPTGLPHTFYELMLEQAVCKEALRLSLEHHKGLIRGLKGVRQERGAGDAFHQTPSGETLVDMMKVKVLIGTGGALSYAPRRAQAAMILLDGLQPEGITYLYVDSWFLLPHMGVLMDIDRDIAGELIEKETLIPLAVCIAPVGPKVTPGRTMARVSTGGSTHDVVAGALQLVDLEGGKGPCLKWSLKGSSMWVRVPGGLFQGISRRGLHALYWMDGAGPLSFHGTGAVPGAWWPDGMTFSGVPPPHLRRIGGVNYGSAFYTQGAGKGRNTETTKTAYPR